MCASRLSRLGRLSALVGASRRVHPTAESTESRLAAPTAAYDIAILEHAAVGQDCPAHGYLFLH
eukprot:12108268-Alexandrium_andersonii.AAC.1